MPPPEAKSFKVHNSPSIDFKLCLVQRYSNAKQGQKNPEKTVGKAKKLRHYPQTHLYTTELEKQKVFYDLKKSSWETETSNLPLEYELK